MIVLVAACGGGQKHMTREELLDPQTCAQCHQSHYTEWSGSMHAYASDDPVFLAMNKRGQRETNGALGSTCVKCHAPLALAEGATTDGLNMDQVPQKLKGITCFFCHSVDAVQGTHDNPLELAGDLVMRGEYKDSVDNDGHASVYSSLHDRDKAESAGLCGSCHDIVVNGHAQIERTFAEWQASVFSHAGGATCGQCHMDQSPHPIPIADVGDVKPRIAHSHQFPGVDVALTPFAQTDAQRQSLQSFLNSTLQSAVCVVNAGSSASAIRVILDDVAAGHGFPSGSAQDRRVWAEVTASKGGAEMYHSGAITAGQPITTGADADMWLMRDCMLDTSGQPVDMFWQADSYETNQLPAQATFDQTDPRFYMTHVVQSFPRDPSMLLPFAPDSVKLQVHVQPMGLEVLNDLVASGDLDPSIPAMMPTYDIDLGAGSTLEWTPAATDTYPDPTLSLPTTCVTLSNLNIAADKVPAANHMKCSP
jgi:hypothetical protein